MGVKGLVTGKSYRVDFDSFKEKVLPMVNSNYHKHVFITDFYMFKKGKANKLISFLTPSYGAFYTIRFENQKHYNYIRKEDLEYFIASSSFIQEEMEI